MTRAIVPAIVTTDTTAIVPAVHATDPAVALAILLHSTRSSSLGVQGPDNYLPIKKINY